jgi:hypothetical protein
MNSIIAAFFMIAHTAVGFLRSPVVPLRHSSVLNSANANDEVSSLKRQPAGQSAIYLPLSRILLPGSTRSIHMYDTNMLLALEQARENELVLIT